jgi:hypothetical protein
MNDDEVLATARASLTRVRETLGEVHMERKVAAVLARARARRLRRGLTATAAAGAALAVSLLLVTGGEQAFGISPGQPGPGAAQARTVAYVVSRVEHALASENRVFYGRTTGNDGPSITWAYGLRNRFEEFTGRACGHTLPNGYCTHHGGSVPFLAQGTALVQGKLRGAYVTYFDRRYSLSPVWIAPPSACSKDARLSMGGPPTPTPRWSVFIHATLACGAASVTGHVRVDGMVTTKITGKPLTIRLSAGYGKLVHEKWVQARWVLYVNPRTYLPVRMYGATETFGGRWGKVTSYSVTDVTWLPPTRANVAKALVTIPPGFHRWWGSPGNQ